MTFLNIFAVVPVTTATGERSFSVLKLEKTYLRAKMTNERLNGLTIVNIHKDVRIDHDVIAENYLAKPVRELPVVEQENHEMELDAMVDQAVHEYDREAHRHEEDEIA